MKDAARLANVSESTVSGVTNKSSPVDELTRRSVEEALVKLNDKPNLPAKGLRIKSSQMDRLRQEPG